MTHTPPSPAPSPKPSPGGYPPLRTGEHWPSVSVIMPILDEEDHLADAVARVFGQDYPGDLEVVLACGPSNDGTDAIAAALAGQLRQFGSNLDVIAPASFFSAVIPLTVFALFQRYFVQGLLAGSVK